MGRTTIPLVVVLLLVLLAWRTKPLLLLYSTQNRATRNPSVSTNWYRAVCRITPHLRALRTLCGLAKKSSSTTVPAAAAEAGVALGARNASNFVLFHSVFSLFDVVAGVDDVDVIAEDCAQEWDQQSSAFMTLSTFPPPDLSTLARVFDKCCR